MKEIIAVYWTAKLPLRRELSYRKKENILQKKETDSGVTEWGMENGEWGMENREWD